ncbi:MAG: glycosyltransferase [Elusimicrobia bacterium]|nr:glycosyltransferase [Elusimicrobiota bacterium]
MGRLEPKKNLGYLIKAFQLLAAQRPNVELVIAGTGTEEQGLRRQVINADLWDKVTFLGHVPHDQLPALYGGCHVFVLPSILEAQPLVVLEAMRFRKPVIVTDKIVSAKIGGPGVNGFIVDADSVEDLADKLTFFYDNPTRRKQMGQTGHDRFPVETAATVAEKLDSLYKSNKPAQTSTETSNKTRIQILAPRRKTRLLKTKALLTRICLSIMPYVPLPGEWYRKLLVKDSEHRYMNGRWNYMNGIEESHRYNAIIGICDFLKPEIRTVLDVGCGEGILQKRMTYDHYVGVDTNERGISLANTRGNENTEFVLSPADRFKPKRTFDVIVFNESLYYMKNPLAILEKYKPFLEKMGSLSFACFEPIWPERFGMGLKKPDGTN